MKNILYSTGSKTSDIELWEASITMLHKDM